MLVLELPPQLEQVIMAQAQYAGLGVNEFVANELKHLQKPTRKLGGGEHLLISISDDFDGPLEDWAEYM